jgi:flavorubredoxin
MKCTPLFRRDDHCWLAFGQDPDRPDSLVDTNQYVISTSGGSLLVDPGGMEVFPSMLAALTHEISVEDLRGIFLSHQDPDVASSLPLWRRVCKPETKIYISSLWTDFVTHLDRDAVCTGIPDDGMELQLGGDVRLRFVPAHFLHSSGNFHIYDPKAKILFSGDVGWALPPAGQTRKSLFVEDFNAHIPLMETFHRRWMGSTRARDSWVEAVSKLDIDMMAPQHGWVFRGDDVKRFIDWFGRLDIGNVGIR